MKTSSAGTTFDPSLYRFGDLKFSISDLPVLPAPADHVETDLVRTRGANIREAGKAVEMGDGSKVTGKLTRNHNFREG